jgi:hypothetical protein
MLKMAEAIIGVMAVSYNMLLLTYDFKTFDFCDKGVIMVLVTLQ